MDLKNSIKDSVLAAITDITRTPKSPATSLVYIRQSRAVTEPYTNRTTEQI